MARRIAAAAAAACLALAGVVAMVYRHPIVGIALFIVARTLAVVAKRMTRNDNA